MNALISTPADCEVRGVILFLQAENVRPCEIHQRLVAVYGEHVSCTCVPNCHQTFAIPQNLCTLGTADWLNSHAAAWYEEGINKLVSRYDKCLNVQGDYVEK